MRKRIIYISFAVIIIFLTFFYISHVIGYNKTGNGYSEKIIDHKYGNCIIASYESVPLDVVNNCYSYLKSNGYDESGMTYYFNNSLHNYNDEYIYAEKEENDIFYVSQYYNGIMTTGFLWLDEDGKIQKTNGLLNSADIDKVSTLENVSKDQAKEIALNYWKIENGDIICMNSYYISNNEVLYGYRFRYNNKVLFINSYTGTIDKKSD